MSASNRTSRIAGWVSVVLLPLGSVLFTTGGAHHPRAGTVFGSVGTPEFYRAFAEHITHQTNWVPIHALILIGPLLWALGAPRRFDATDAASAMHRPTANVIDALASRVLILGATLWAVVFVVDGLVAPQSARHVVSAAPSDLPAMLAVFRADQQLVISLGLVSWILIGVAIAMFGTALLVRARRATGRTVLGAFGLLVGLWPVYATLTGEFNPGPFTSQYWNVTALSSALWFAAFGVSALRRSERAVAPPVSSLAPRTLAPTS